MRILRIPETEAKSGYCDRQLRELESQGRFPKRFKLNPPDGRAVGHLESDVEKWITERAAAREAVQ